MTKAAWRWLPDSALSDPKALAAVDQVLADWSRRWLPEDRLRCQAPVFDVADARPPAAQGGRWILRAPGAGPDALAGRALGLELARLEVGEGDRRLIDGFADAMLTDLVEALDEAAPGPNNDDVSGVVQIAITDGEGRRLLTLSTSRAVLAGLRRAGLPERARDRPALSPIRSAIGSAKVILCAQLGSAVMPVSDARRLAPGDVIILDRKLEEPIALAATPDGSSLACGRLVDTASPRALRLQPSPPRASS